MGSALAPSVHAYVEDVLNARRLDLLGLACTPDVVQLGPAGAPAAQGRAALVEALARLFRRLPHLAVRPRGHAGDGDGVLLRSRVEIGHLDGREEVVLHFSGFRLGPGGRIAVMSAPASLSPAAQEASRPDAVLSLQGLMAGQAGARRPRHGRRQGWARADDLGGDPRLPGALEDGTLRCEWGRSPSPAPGSRGRW